MKSSTSYLNIFSNKYFKASKHTFELNMLRRFYFHYIYKRVLYNNAMWLYTGQKHALTKTE